MTSNESMETLKCGNITKNVHQLDFSQNEDNVARRVIQPVWRGR